MAIKEVDGCKAIRAAEEGEGGGEGGDSRTKVAAVERVGKAEPVDTAAGGVEGGKGVGETEGSGSNGEMQERLVKGRRKVGGEVEGVALRGQLHKTLEGACQMVREAREEGMAERVLCLTTATPEKGRPRKSLKPFDGSF